MVRRAPERGDTKIGCVLWLAVVVFFSYVAYQAVPIKVKSAELEDYMIRQAESAANTTIPQLEKRFLRRAKELELPVDKKKLKVAKRAGRVIATYRFTIPISMFVYTYDWEFEIKVDRPFFDI
jgi:hypothetical protein